MATTRNTLTTTPHCDGNFPTGSGSDQGVFNRYLPLHDHLGRVDVAHATALPAAPPAGVPVLVAFGLQPVVPVLAAVAVALRLQRRLLVDARPPRHRSVLSTIIPSHSPIALSRSSC